MANAGIPGKLEMGALDAVEPQRPAPRPIEERLQKRPDKVLYAGGQPTAQKIRDTRTKPCPYVSIACRMNRLWRAANHKEGAEVVEVVTYVS
jgi:hypothetical protein